MFVEILEEVREKHDFVVAGYVVMPEHFHLLISEPRIGKLPFVMQVLKQRVSRRCRRKRKKSATQMKLWEDQGPPSSSRPVITTSVLRKCKYVEKLLYIHRNPVKRGLVASPELWRWSSYRDYGLGEARPVKIGE